MFNLKSHIHLPHGIYPKRKLTKRFFQNTIINNSSYILNNIFSLNNFTYKLATKHIIQKYDEYKSLQMSDVRENLSKYRKYIKKKHIPYECVINIFSLARVIIEHENNILLNERQLQAALGLIFCNIVDTDVRENRELIPLFPAIVYSYAGIPVHLISLNDNNTQQNYDSISNLFQQFDLSTGFVLSNSTQEKRKQAYQSDISFCSYKELIFDYLRDSLILGSHTGELQLKLELLYKSPPRRGQLYLRGLTCALVYDADQILIEEANSPISLNGVDENCVESDIYNNAIRIAYKFKLNKDFVLNTKPSEITITDAGIKKLSNFSKSLKSYWHSEAWRNNIVKQALTALHIYQKDKDYTVLGDGICRINTGSEYTTSNFVWENGIKHLVEAKENCTITPHTTTQTSINLQRFFQQYHKLSGLTENAKHLKNEFWNTFHLQTLYFNQNNSSRIMRIEPLMYGTIEEKFSGIINKIKELSIHGYHIIIFSYLSNTIYTLTHVFEQLKIPFKLVSTLNNDESSHYNQTMNTSQITIISDISYLNVYNHYNEEPKTKAFIISTEYPLNEYYYNMMYNFSKHLNGIFEIYTSLDDNIFMQIKNKWYYRILLSFNKANILKNIQLSYILLRLGINYQNKVILEHRNRLLKNDYYLEQSMNITRLYKHL